MYPPPRHPLPLHRRLRPLLARISAFYFQGVNGSSSGKHKFPRVPLKRRIWNLLTLRNVLILCWMSLLYWGERTVFRDAMKACQWDKWENWPSGARPYRMGLIADPQLVDIHTYPRRGIALSATIFYTDLFMTKSFSLLNSILMPQSTIFLGDLFDGGREWAPTGSFVTNGNRKGHLEDPSAEPDWRWYGASYWEAEFARFNNIFPPLPGRRSIRSLPGNHDLGIGNGIEESVLGRFRAFFGETSAVHVLGNHTFVLVDSVSLENTDNPKVYGPARAFLDEFPQHIPTTLRGVDGGGGAAITRPGPLFPHLVKDSDKPETKTDTPATTSPPPRLDLPRILLTHVPLYREPDTDCGPLRESSSNAISVRGGFQYQNVLRQDVTADVLRKVQPVLVASGDDHDYCEVLHAGATDMVREVTVKSFSLAMGVRRPGFLLVSLWNPGAGPASGDTVQTKLCLLPDQLGIFATYGLAFMFTKLAFTLKVLWAWLRRKKQNQPLLPLAQDHKHRHSHSLKHQSADYNDYAASSSSWNSTSNINISTRSGSGSGSGSSTSGSPRASYAKSHGHGHGYGYGIPLSSSKNADNDNDADADDDDKYAKKPLGLGIAGMPGLALERNINTHLTQLGTAAGNVGALVADKFVERVPSLAPVVEGGREMVRREIENSGGMGGWCAKMWQGAKELGVCVVVVGGWYLWLLSTDV